MKQRAVLRFLINNVLSPVIAAGLREQAYDALHVRDYGMQVVFEQSRLRVRALPFGDAS